MISIHTLTWRVTAFDADGDWLEDISIHTLTWRVTSASLSGGSLWMYFNPHPHVEGDADDALLTYLLQSISIHTLTWRVTGR